MKVLEMSTRHHGYSFAGMMVGAIAGFVIEFGAHPNSNGCHQTMIGGVSIPSMPLYIAAGTVLGLVAGAAVSFQRCVRAHTR